MGKSKTLLSKGRKIRSKRSFKSKGKVVEDVYVDEIGSLDVSQAKILTEDVECPLEAKSLAKAHQDHTLGMIYFSSSYKSVL